MPHDETLDPAAILAALRIADVTAIAPVQGGTATSIWRVTHGAVTSALRVFQPDQDSACQEEIAAMELARGAGVPVPELRAAGIYQERPALLLAWCPGVPLWEAVRQQPWRVLALGRAFGRAQAQIHRISAPDGARAEWIGWAGSGDPRLAAALQRLARPVPALLHGDFHPMNVLADGARVTAVLDWANTRYGDPRADVARTYTILMVEPFTPGREPLHIALVRRLVTLGWRRGYREVAGPLTDMAPFYAWAGAVMARDLAGRVSDPDSWWQPSHMQQIARWTAGWRRRAERVIG